MKKRFRKKLRLGEFREFGFEVSFRLSEALDESGLEHFWDSFITEAIEAQGLMCSGTCGRAWDVFVSRPARAPTTDADRVAVGRWLQRHLDVSGLRVGPLVDAWHSA
ncbi:MAG: YggL family protein [Candidatus Rokubacteria bacterium]|nr:YggL family protein [Candidatus Rokubacteria bacterium]